MPITPEDLLIPRASLSDSANIEEAVNPALERISAIMAPQDQGPWSTIPPATPARKGWRYLVTSGQRLGSEYVCTGVEWLRVHSPTPTVTTLPTAAEGSFDGQRVRLDVGAGVYWRLERDGAYWHPLGGQRALRSMSTVQVSGVGDSWTSYNNEGVTIPVKGQYDYVFGVAVWFMTGGTSASRSFVTVARSLTTPIDTDLPPLSLRRSRGEGGSGSSAPVGATELRSSVTLNAGEIVRVAGMADPGVTHVMEGRWVAVTPARLTAS